jgi:uncharacterized protein
MRDAASGGCFDSLSARGPAARSRARIASRAGFAATIDPMNDFTPLSALLGGGLIGAAASLLLLTHGRIAGISGLYGGMLRRGTRDRGFRLSFIAGLVFVGTLVRVFCPAAFASTWSPTLPVVLAAGLLVGFGTQLGNGCTSGHGVCGISRLSVRSLVATGTFLATGVATVFVVRHLLGGGK